MMAKPAPLGLLVRTDHYSQGQALCPQWELWEPAGNGQ